MHNPQKENGYTAIANEIMEQLATINLSPHETRVLLAILRKTYGWSKKVDQISLSQFEKATALDRRSITRALKRLEVRRVIIVLREGQRGVNWYRFNKLYDQWAVHNSADKEAMGRGCSATTPRGYSAPTVVGVLPPPTITTLKTMITKTSEEVMHITASDEGVRVDSFQHFEEQRQALIIKLSSQ